MCIYVYLKWRDNAFDVDIIVRYKIKESITFSTLVQHHLLKKTIQCAKNTDFTVKKFVNCNFFGNIYLLIGTVFAKIYFIEFMQLKNKIVVLVRCGFYKWKTCNIFSQQISHAKTVFYISHEFGIKMCLM